MNEWNNLVIIELVISIKIFKTAASARGKCEAFVGVKQLGIFNAFFFCISKQFTQNLFFVKQTALKI